jgi:Zn-finger nucleic acid-binding protein
MNCPNCEGVTLVMSERQGIEIDYCPQCRGVWLDRGELDKKIDRSVAESPRQEVDREPRGYTGQHDPSHGRHESHHGGHYKKKKREGFLSDLFDFG